MRKLKGRLTQKNVLPIFCGIIISLLAFFENSIERYCLAHSSLTYRYFPVYLGKGVSCLAWAVFGRIGYALFRKEFYSGKMKINLSAILTFSTLLLLGGIDWFMGHRVLFLNQFFDFLAMLSALCIIVRDKV